jgi:regulator of cell morphogenesis and NO signaling
MYQTNKTYVKPDMNISEIIRENPSILLVLENFGIDDVLHDKSISELCNQFGISENLFLVICNFYNGFSYSNTDLLTISDIPVIISYLNNSHLYYINEKYPEIIEFIGKLNSSDSFREMKLVQAFFNEYFQEVKDHLEYEEKIAFPYIENLLENGEPGNESFSANQYLSHHSDIESKLEDLKNLLLQHLHIKNQRSIKRKLLYALFELEFDLTIHSRIEEQILIPLVISLETKKK